MNKQRKISLNLIIGIFSQVFTILFGIFVPKLTLTSYGSEVNGLLSSVTQIYSYIGLLEAGVGTVTVQALYRTLSKNSKEETNSVLAATNKFYKRTGFFYLTAIVLFSVLYPFTIKSEIPKTTIALVIIFNGLGNVISFFFQAKYLLLLEAEGKNYIKTILATFTNTFKSLSKIILMVLGFDVVVVQIVSMIVSLIQMIYISYYIKTKYSWLNLSVKPDFKSISQRKNALVHQLSSLVFNNTDTIILTYFCGLKVVSVYSMYTLVLSMVSTALGTISSSFIFALGHLFNLDKNKFIKLFDCYETYYLATVFSLYSIATFFILPFLKLFTMGLNDGVQYVDYNLAILFVLTHLLSSGRSAISNILAFAGHYKLTQNRAIIESLINILVSLIAVQFVGIYGVLIGTIVALLYRTNDIIIYANHRILNRSPVFTYKRWIVQFLLYIIIVLFVNKHINISLDSYWQIAVWLVPYSVFVGVLFFGVASIVEPKNANLVFKLLLKKKVQNFD